MACIGLELTMQKHIWFIRLDMKWFILIWLIIVLMCMSEAYISTKYDDEL